MTTLYFFLAVRRKSSDLEVAYGVLGGILKVRREKLGTRRPHQNHDMNRINSSL